MDNYSSAARTQARRTGGPPRTIVLVANGCWNLVHFRAPIIARLIATGARVVAVAPPDEKKKALAEMGVEYIPLAMSRSGLSPTSDFALLYNYRRILRELQPDALLGFTIKPNVYASLAARGLGIKVINNVSGLGTSFLSTSGLRVIVTWLYRVSLSQSSTVFFQNVDDRDLFVRKGIVRESQVAVLPGSGIDLEHFTAAPLNGHSGPTKFLFVGRLLGDKGLRELADAARLLRAWNEKFSITLLGPSDPLNRSAVPEAELRSWVADKLVNRLEAVDDVRPAIAASDCLLLPSYREGLPRTLIEAAAMARPAIASDVAGCRHIIVPGETGWLVPPRDAYSLASAMRLMIRTSRTRRVEMGSAARALAESRFDQAMVVDSYERALASGEQ